MSKKEYLIIPVPTEDGWTVEDIELAAKNLKSRGFKPTGKSEIFKISTAFMFEFEKGE